MVVVISPALLALNAAAMLLAVTRKSNVGYCLFHGKPRNHWMEVIAGAKCYMRKKLLPTLDHPASADHALERFAALVG